MIEATADTTVDDFKEVVLKTLFEDEFTRRVTVVDLLLGEKRMESASTLADSGVSSEAEVLAVFSTRLVECIRMQDAPHELNHVDRAVVLTIPAGSTEIPDEAFSGCTSIQSLTIPDSVTRIGCQAFDGCSSLTCLTIPKSVTQIGDLAFCGCSSLTELIMADSVTSIGDGAFSDCSALSHVAIPDSVSSMGDRAFSDCSSLSTVSISESLTILGLGAFLRCGALRSLRVPQAVWVIEDEAFAGCSSLSRLSIERPVVMGRAVFDGCKLRSLTLPDSFEIEAQLASDCEIIRIQPPATEKAL